MAYKVSLFHYSPDNSILHNVDSRIKLVLILLFCFLVFLLKIPILFLLLLAEFILLLISKIRMKQLMKELSRFFILIIVIFFFRAYSSEGVILLFDFIIIPGSTGFISGGIIVLRICMVVFFGLILTATTKISDIQNALHFFFSLIPFFPAARFAALMSLTIKSIPLLFDKLHEVDEAQKARCIEINKNPIYRIISFAIPLLIHILKQADDIASAMEARCYSEHICAYSRELMKNDYIFLIAAILYSSLILVLNFCY